VKGLSPLTFHLSLQLMERKNIKNIIFDLGGVILNIDFKKSEQAFTNLGIHNFTQLYSQFHATDLFLNFEKGKISPDQFIQALQSQATGISAEKIVDAWNAMLLDFPPGRIEFLLALGKRYRTFLLSNTNAIHHQAFQKIYPPILADRGSLDSCFERAYYSHVIGMRKPDKEIYEWVVNENSLIAEETLFVDDTPGNVEAAESVHIRGLYLKHPLTIQEALGDY
jgi:glucose-1-phosphatase